MSNLATFTRQVRSRSDEHQKAMALLEMAGLAGQMVSILRQELDSMVRVIYLLTQDPERRAGLIEASVHGEKWTKSTSKGRITDKEMVDLSQKLQGWTLSVYKFGCAFIHLSNLHDYNDRDPMFLLPDSERNDIIQHCRAYHGGPISDQAGFPDILPYIPRALNKISGNLECYLKYLEQGKDLDDF